jgi:hypothetical protein
MDYETGIRQLQATARRLAETDPQSEAVQRVCDELQAQVQWLGQIEKPTGYKANEDFGANSLKNDISFIGEQVKKLKSAAEPAARNYTRIVSILAGLQRATEIAKRPQYAAIRPRIALIVQKVAGVFECIDTVEDLDKPLEQIEKAVHGLYGDQSKNSTYYFDRRGKGHHEKNDAEAGK